MPDPTPPAWRRPVPLALGLALLVGLPTLAIPWVMDDWFILMTNAAWLGAENAHWWAISETQADPLGLPSSFCFAEGDPAAGARWRAAGVYPWWTDPGLRLCFWRPLASLSHLADFLVSRGPLLAHVHSLLWYLLLVAGVARFWGRRLGGGVALLAAALFAIDDAHAFPVAWVANRNGLMSAALAAWALVAQDARRPLAAVGLVGLALLGGESGLGAVGLLAAHAWVYRRDSQGRVPVALVGALVLAVGWLGAYAALGFGAQGSGLYASPFSEPGRWLLGAAAHLPMLTAVMLAPMPADLLMADPGLLPLVLGQSLVVLGLVGWGLRRLWPTLEAHEQNALRFAVVGFLLAALPALSTTPTSRLATLPGIAGVGALALMVRAFLRERRKDKAERDRKLFGLGAFMALFHTVVAGLAWPGITTFLVQGDAVAKEHLDATEALLDGAETAVLLVASDPALTVYLPDASVAQGRKMTHWSTLSHTPVPHMVRRTGPARIELESQGEAMNRRPFAALYRAEAAGFEVGERIETEAYTVEVQEVDDTGHPVRIAVDFGRPLEDPGLAVLHWDGEALVRWVAPAVGEEVEVAWSPGLAGL